MDGLDYVAPFVGAMTLEAVHRYELREKLHLKKYRQLLGSPAYWLVTGDDRPRIHRVKPTSTSGTSWRRVNSS